MPDKGFNSFRDSLQSQCSVSGRHERHFRSTHLLTRTALFRGHSVLCIEIRLSNCARLQDGSWRRYGRWD